jgi:hypothetical protein
LAASLEELRALVRGRLRDIANVPYRIKDAELDSMIVAGVGDAATHIDLGEAWINGAVTIAAGSDTATLPVAEYAEVYALRRTSDKKELVKCTPGEMDARASATADADPTHYSLMEDTAQLVTVRFQAKVRTTGTLDIRRSVLPDDLTSPTQDAPVSMYLRNAIADLAAAEGAVKLTKPELDILRLSSEAADFWLERAKRSIRAEVLRRASLESAGRSPARRFPR